MNLLIVRHGEIPSNVNKIYAGRSDEGLTPNGIFQAEEVAERLTSYNVHSIYSSPIFRARQTAAIVGDKIGVKVSIKDEFREMELGPWEGLSEEDVARLYPAEWQTWQKMPADLRLPGRETLDGLLKRALTGIPDIFQNKGDGGVVIVTHVAVIRVLLLWHSRKSLNLYKTLHVPNACIFEIKLNNSPDCANEFISNNS